MVVAGPTVLRPPHDLPERAPERGAWGYLMSSTGEAKVGEKCRRTVELVVALADAVRRACGWAQGPATTDGQPSVRRGS
jgi:hypothetical protein